MDESLETPPRLPVTNGPKNVVGMRVAVRLTSGVDYCGMFTLPMPRAWKQFVWFRCIVLP
jgi:hypothetical protein